MRHQKKGFKLGRTHAHRKATLAALSSALIRHKRIQTTLPKAKALRMFVEPLINRAKDDTMHNRRQVFRRLQDKHAVTELFGEIAEQLGDRPGGYTRIVKLGQRAGDGAPMAIIELVDYNDVKPEGGSTRKRRTRRGSGRRRGGTGASKPEATPQPVETTDAGAAPAAEAIMPEVMEEEIADSAEEIVEDLPEQPDAEVETNEVAAEDAPEAAADEAPAATEEDDEAKKDAE